MSNWIRNLSLKDATLQGIKKVRKKATSREHYIQTECVKWFNKTYPDDILYAIPNGGKRHLYTAIKLKAEGVVAGIPDLFLARVTKDYGGLYLEMKSETGCSTPKQKIMQEKLRSKKYKVIECHSVDFFKSEVIKYVSLI